MNIISNENLENSDYQTYEQKEKCNVQATSIGFELFYDLFQLLVITFYPFSQIVSFVDTFFCFLVNNILSLVDCLDFMLQAFYSNNNIVNHNIQLSIFFLKILYLFFIFLKILGQFSI